MRFTPARLGALALALLLMLALSAAKRDTSPPELYIEVAERVAQEAPFDLFLSANEPVNYRVEYGDLRMEKVSQDLTISLLGLLGPNTIFIVASDAAGNETVLERAVTGVAEPNLELTAPPEVSAGDPLTVMSSWNDNGAQLVENELIVGATAVAQVEGPSEKRMLIAVPLASTQGEWEIRARLVDEFGRVVEAVRQVRVLPGLEPVQELDVPATTLAVITPEGRESERTALEQAFAASSPLPFWSSTFQLPIEGRSTSGFALPRRYARGGPVSFHEGSDIGAPAGTPIVASNDGRVLVADFFPIKGGLTVIDHGASVTSLYFHQSSIAVEPGEVVKRGDTIGEVGSTGLSTGPHLHWEMRIAGLPTNPMKWVGKVWP